MVRRLLPALAVILLLAGCGGAPTLPAASGVEVSGAFGSVPVVTFEAPLAVQQPSVTRVIRGDGRTLVPRETVLLSLTAYDGEDGTLIPERSANVRTLLLTEEDVGEDLYPVLDGAKEGTRLLMLQPVEEGSATSMLVVVVDILHTRAVGEPVQPPDGLPTVTLDERGVPTAMVGEGMEEPTQLRVVPLIVGTGRQVTSGQRVTLQYTAWNWDDGSVYDSTWEKDAIPATVTIDETFEGLRDGLLDQKVGSQVLLLIPAALAHGSDANVMVVDILAAEDIVPPSAPATAPAPSTTAAATSTP